MAVGGAVGSIQSGRTAGGSWKRGLGGISADTLGWHGLLWTRKIGFSSQAECYGGGGGAGEAASEGGSGGGRAGRRMRTTIREASSCCVNVREIAGAV